MEEKEIPISRKDRGDEEEHGRGGVGGPTALPEGLGEERDRREPQQGTDEHELVLHDQVECIAPEHEALDREEEVREIVVGESHALHAGVLETIGAGKDADVSDMPGDVGVQLDARDDVGPRVAEQGEESRDRHADARQDVGGSVGGRDRSFQQGLPTRSSPEAESHANEKQGRGDDGQQESDTEPCEEEVFGDQEEESKKEGQDIIGKSDESLGLQDP